MGVCIDQDNIEREVDKLLEKMDDFREKVACAENIDDLDDAFESGVKIQTRLVEQLAYIQGCREKIRSRDYGDGESDT